MKICRFIHDGSIVYGKLEEGIVSIFSNFSFDNPNVHKFSERIGVSGIERFLSPVTPSKIVCVGRNYAAHAAELGNEIPKQPLLFLKAPSAIITDGDQIKIPTQSDQVEHEGELAVVIGKSCKNLGDDANAFDYVVGYTSLNDVTARDLQRSDVQFTRAKSFDTFCPVGPSIETELDVRDLSVITKVNGVIKQNGRTSNMVFNVPYLVRYISNQLTLNAGDIIATGTPSGVSKLSSGDVVEVEIEGLDRLQNAVIDS